MGARPIALLNSLRFGSLEQPKVKYLFENVVAGIAGYGNCMGIPTVGGEVVFEDCYEGNPLVNAMCVGLIDHNQIQKGVAVGVGNPVIYVGASTGRDGIHGATFASEELNEASEAKRPAVQVGDPFMEKLLLEACLEVIATGLVLGIQDMGAAGLTSSSAEMASKGGNGIEMNLDEVPQREPGMTPYEMMLSESQERMLLVVEKGNEDAVKAIFDKWGLHSKVIGRVTEEKRLRLLHKGEVVVDLPIAAIVDEAPVYNKPSKVPAYFEESKDYVEVLDHLSYSKEELELSLVKLLQSPTISNKEWVYSQYDHQVRTSTAVVPGSDAAVVRIRGTRKALAMTTDCNGRYVYLDPKTGGAIAIAEAARNLVCSGAAPLAVTDCLNYGSPEKPEIFWQLEQSVEGMSEACVQLGTPVIGGNVSLYNETKGEAIYPTPVIGMVGLIEDVDHITTQSFKTEGDIIILLGETKTEISGSEFQKVILGKTAGRPPGIDLDKEKALQSLVLNLIRSGGIASAHDLAEGGLGVALAESSMSGNIGCRIEMNSDLRPDVTLYSETQSRIILSITAGNVDAVKAKIEQANVPYQVVGIVGGKNVSIQINEQLVTDVPVPSITAAWKGAIPWLMKKKSLTS